MSQPPPSPGSRVLSRRGTTHFSVPKQELFDQQSSREEINAEREELKSVHFLGRAQGLMSGVLPLAAAFDKFDEDGSGGIDSQELRKALEYLGVDVGSNEKAQAILEAYDSVRRRRPPTSFRRSCPTEPRSPHCPSSSVPYNSLLLRRITVCRQYHRRKGVHGHCPRHADDAEV